MRASASCTRDLIIFRRANLLFCLLLSSGWLVGWLVGCSIRMVAALMVSGVTLDKVLPGAMDILAKLRAFFKNPTKGLVSMHEQLEQLLQRVLPENAHKICNNRLGISVTKLWPLENIFVCQFESRQDLIDAVLAGCFIPLWSGQLEFPTYRGLKCVDGGYSDNIPKFPHPDQNDDDNYHHNEMQTNQRSFSSSFMMPLRQVQLSALASDADISPPERYGINFKCFGTRYYLSWDTIQKSVRTLLPLDTESYLKYLHQGHRDMKNYILSNGMVRCQQCTWVLAPPSVRWPCLYCLKLMEKIDGLKVPRNLINIVKQL